jgi:probable F420-dependent oxidoreductase
MKIDSGTMINNPVEGGPIFSALEEAGYDGAYTWEGAHDPFLPLVSAAMTTSKIELMTSIAVAFSRNPMNLANVAYDLQLLSKGRFILGLGSQIQPHITKRFSMPWSKPAARMEDMVTAIKAILNAWQNESRLEHRGEFYNHTLMTPLFNPGPNPFGIPKIYVAAVGPLMTKAVARSADGLLAHPFNTPTYLKNITLPLIDEALSSVNKQKDAFDLSISVMTGIGATEESHKKAVRACRDQVAFYASTPNYRAVLEQQGYEELSGELNRLSKEGKWKQMGDAIDDEILNTFAVISESPQELAKEILNRYGKSGERIAPILYSGELDLAVDVLRALKAN